MVLKTLLIILVISILLEDSASIKKTEEEKREDDELARVVNATLEAEEEKKKEEEAKKKKDEESKKEDKHETKDGKDKDEACPPANVSCPIVKPCKKCPDLVECQPCPEIKGCDPCQECPSIKCQPCPRCEESKESEECPPLECPPVYCQPCPVVNRTSLSVPGGCPETSGQPMSIPVAMAVGAAASVLVMGVATTVGLVIRYVSPIASGFIFVSTIIIVWYLSSQYPETARELGRRAWTTLQEATVTLGHRVVEALRHHNDQVGFSC
jgi:hypothetical protein